MSRKHDFCRIYRCTNTTLLDPPGPHPSAQLPHLKGPRPASGRAVLPGTAPARTRPWEVGPDTSGGACLERACRAGVRCLAASAGGGHRPRQSRHAWRAVPSGRQRPGTGCRAGHAGCQGAHLRCHLQAAGGSGCRARSAYSAVRLRGGRHGSVGLRCRGPAESGARDAGLSRTAQKGRENEDAKR